MQSPSSRIGANTIAVLLTGVAALRVLMVHRNYGLLGLDSYPIAHASLVTSGVDLWRILLNPLMDGPIGRMYYRPLVHLAFAFDGLLWGLEPAGYHLTSACIFAFTGLAVYALVVAALPRASPLVPLVVLAVFLVHPVHAAVLPVPPRRGDLLCLAFMALAAAAQARAATRRGSEVSFLPALATGLALASNEKAFVLPAICLMIAFLYTNGGASRRVRRTMAHAVPIVAVFAATIGIRLGVLGGVIGARPLRDGDYISSAISMVTNVGRGVLGAGYEVGMFVLGFAALAAGLSRLRIGGDRPSAAPWRAVVVGAVWVGLVAGLYSMGLILPRWYFMVPLGGALLVIGAAATTLMTAWRRPELLPRIAAAGGVLCLAVLFLQLAVRSPLFRPYPEYASATVETREYLATLADRIDAAPDGTLLWLPAPPTAVPRSTGPGYAFVGIAPHTVKAWAALMFPTRQIRTETRRGRVGPIDARELVLLLGRPMRPAKSTGATR